MHVIFKIGVLFFCFAASRSEEEVLKCNLRYCGSELLNFDDFGFSQLFRKLELASFCVKNCTPPVMHEFFQSVIFAVTRRIPGYCSGSACVDKNRFVALGKCAQDEAWSLLQCTKTLIDLAHIGLIKNPEDLKRNTTCRIITESVQCIEETLQNCGEVPFQLVKEILGDFIRIGINAYCHPAYRHEGWIMKRTTGVTADPSLPTTTPFTEGPGYKHPQFVKGYNPNSAFGLQHLSHVCLFVSLTLSTVLAIHRTP